MLKCGPTNPGLFFRILQPVVQFHLLRVEIAQLFFILQGRSIDFHIQTGTADTAARASAPTAASLTELGFPVSAIAFTTGSA
jgi:hypothetical protein